MTNQDGELLDAAGGDRARARILGQLLQHIARNSPDERLREMASDVVDGRISLAEAVGSAYYGEAIAKQAAGFATWYDSLSETERREQAEAGAAEIAKVRDEIDRNVSAERRDSTP
ncbi:hypothetical protein [Plantactinospora endophytica]|uniref:DNA primase n=1 Tax=Plantactinospora endophytica TaxID=673535 RepID=A0ABQ4E8I1_9ACTN|nr:hypothetical protein [Plantactinospora endophytica]GIG91018.1 hypothetical protein Pen02_59540 [Plantactinospora endophytica]